MGSREQRLGFQCGEQSNWGLFQARKSRAMRGRLFEGGSLGGDADVDVKCGLR